MLNVISQILKHKRILRELLNEEGICFYTRVNKKYLLQMCKIKELR